MPRPSPSHSSPYPHSLAATDIRLDTPIRETLATNCCGSRRVAELAGRMTRLRALVHVSTCYVSMNQPRGARVEER